MSDPSGDRHHYKHHDSRPGEAPDRSAEIAVQDTFPASAPVAPTAAVGSPPSSAPSTRVRRSIEYGRTGRSPGDQPTVADPRPPR